MERLHSLSRVLAAVAAVLVVTSCAPHDLVFRSDDRLEIVQPRQSVNSDVVTVKWVVHEAIPKAAGYLVLVDRSPQPAGEGLDQFVKNDPDCKKGDRASCLTREYLRRKQVYVTTGTEVTLDRLRDNSTGSKSTKHQHEVIVIPIDAQARRLGEAAWSEQFVVTKGGQS
jgi:hypothetical protein